MGRYLNPGNELFHDHLRNKIYVDKSGLIACLNDYILNDDEKYVCVSRPRRFGKSYAADMLTAYYGRGCDSHVLFDNYEISRSPDYEKHINKYNVIYIDVSSFIDSSVVASYSVSKMIETLQSDILFELKEEYPDVKVSRDDLVLYFDGISSKYGEKFVFVIDEWDAIVRCKGNDAEGLRTYLRFLNSFLKQKKYVALAYMTGILPIKKYGNQSALNMFKEISMTDADPLQEFMGFTKKEVQVLCKGDKEKEDGIKNWYNGYTVNGEDIYNPYAVGEAIRSTGALHGCWTGTETYEALEIYIKTNAYGVQEDLIDLLNKKPVEVETDGFTNDMTTLRGRDDVLTLLIHLGYLTMSYDDEKKKKYVRIPNKEVREQFLISMKKCGMGNADNVLPTSEKVLDATLKGDSKSVAEYVEIIHQERASMQDYNEEISLKYVIQFAFVAAERHYSMVREMPAGKGYADMAFIPYEKTPAYPPMVIELKVRGPKSGAMNQIKKKQYERFLKGYEGDVVLVGIHYNRRTKEHSCQIKRVKVKR